MAISKSVTLLHLSDIQFGSHHRFGADAVSLNAGLDTLLELLFEDLQHLDKKHRLSPDLLIITGDLTEQGQKKEFEEVFTFVDGLAKRLELPHDRVILVPGNHDIHRDVCQAYFLNHKAETGTEPLPPFWPKWKFFVNFFNLFYQEQKFEFTQETPWTFFEIPELSLVVAGLNSTMRESHRKEDHHGEVGKEQLQWFAECLAKYKQRGWFRIGAIHHNVRRNATDDDEHLQDFNLLRDELHDLLNLLLHGHTHEGESDVLENNVPILAAGSTALQTEQLPHGLSNQYQIIQIEPNQLTRWCRAYAPDRKKWIGDTRADPDGDAWKYTHKTAFVQAEEFFSDQAQTGKNSSDKNEWRDEKPDDFLSHLLAIDPIQEAWPLDEWQRDAHMSNAFETSPEQAQIITQIRAGLQSETKHIRVLGEPGLGKTRIVLESVKDENIAPYVLYIQHGSQFGQTRLFRQLLKASYDKPLILVIDELPESELADIWRHLKPRCGSLKIVSLDHGRDETHDAKIERLNAPRLSDETIKKIFVNRVGESREIDRWVAFCEGSPRVAQAVADNLCANPDDLLKPPATIPIWTRFLHGYDRRDEMGARQVDCVALHLALFSRFGYEMPVGDEAAYIAERIKEIDPTIGWARFQEIVQSLRARRVLQGSKTLFFVPKALHIYLWKQFWEYYGRGFDFTQTFSAMPESLHVWFMNMFKYAGDAATSHVINDILKLGGIFSERAVLTSEKGSRFLSILAEANPTAVLKLLEAAIGKWTDQQLSDFNEGRQHIVWTLEKIAVWQPFTVKAIHVLTRLAVNKNANFSNNSTDILVGLFCIGPEAAATESTPEARLPAMLKLLHINGDAGHRLGLKAMEAALDSHGMGFRTIGPEYQGLKERAKLWIPKTYGEWWQAKFLYFQTLVDETRNWPSYLRAEVCDTLLKAVKHQIEIPPCTELAFQVLGVLMDDSAMPPEKLNDFFWRWQEYKGDGKHPEIAKRLRSCERRYTRRNLASRFQRYVIDVGELEWDEDFRERYNKPKNRAKALVDALARRIARHPDKLNEIRHLLSPTKYTPALWHFGEQAARNDDARALLATLIHITLKTKRQECLHGYLSAVRASNPDFYLSTISGFLNMKNTAWLGITITLRSDYNDGLFVQCLDALEKRWIDPLLFGALRSGKAIGSVPLERARRLFYQLDEFGSQEALLLTIELLDSIPFEESSPFDSNFVYKMVSSSIPGKKFRDQMHGYHWKNVCLKLIEWDASRTISLLDVLLTEMNKDCHLSYDHYVEPLASELIQADPTGAWKIIKRHFEETLPKWRGDLLHWLKGGLGGFDNEESPRAAVADLPLAEILEWIEQDPEPRAALVAHAAPKTLDDAQGGQLTRVLLHRYGQFDGVENGISATFYSDGWTGPESVYLKQKREKFRLWLASGFEIEIIQWIESEIEYLDQHIERAEIGEERSQFD